MTRDPTVIGTVAAGPGLRRPPHAAPCRAFGGHRMIALTWIPEAIRGLTWLYALAALAALAVALARPRTWRGKLGFAAGVIAVFGYLPFMVLKDVRKDQEAAAARQQRLAAAMAHFQMRCKSAGEKIHRTVDNVDGVVWMKWRDERGNHGDQFKLDDPFGHDCGGEACIEQLLRLAADAQEFPQEAAMHRVGYRFVESIHPKDGRKYRYVGAMKLSPSWTADGIAKLKKETGEDPPKTSYLFTPDPQAVDRFDAAYGITWDDISTREDRDYWIAGGSLKVVDLRTSEVIAERTGYMLDRGQGSTAGFRSPWLYAVQDACPAYPHGPNDALRGRTLHETRDFLLKVLRPSTGD